MGGEANIGAPVQTPLVHVEQAGKPSVREDHKAREKAEAQKYLQQQQVDFTNEQVAREQLSRIRNQVAKQFKLLQASEVEQLLLQRFPEAAPLLRSTEATHQLPTNPSQRTAALPATEAPVNAGAETGRTDSQPGTTAGGDNQAFALQQQEGLQQLARGDRSATLKGSPGSSIPTPSTPGPATPQPQMAVRQLPQPPQSQIDSRTGPNGQPLVGRPLVTPTPKLASADPSVPPANANPEESPPARGSADPPGGKVKQFALGEKTRYPPGAATPEQEAENLALAVRLGVLQNGGPTIAKASTLPANTTGPLTAKKETVAERGKGDAGKAEGKGGRGDLDGAFALGLRRQAQSIPA